jgi:hypothetical protein
MSHRHLGEAAHQQQGKHRSKQVGKNHARACDANREGTAKEQAGADGAPDGHHAKLALRELARQSLLFSNKLIGVAAAFGLACIHTVWFPQCNRAWRHGNFRVGASLTQNSSPAKQGRLCSALKGRARWSKRRWPAKRNALPQRAAIRDVSRLRCPVYSNFSGFQLPLSLSAS